MNKKLHLFLLITGLLWGCSTSVHRGSVAMKISDTEAHVCLGSGEVKVGDKIKLYHNICTRNALPANKPSKNLPGSKCELRIIGEGQIASLINDHYSIATFAGGVQFEEGDIVERGTSQ